MFCCSPHSQSVVYGKILPVLLTPSSGRTTFQGVFNDSWYICFTRSDLRL